MKTKIVECNSERAIANFRSRIDVEIDISGDVYVELDPIVYQDVTVEYFNHVNKMLGIGLPDLDPNNVDHQRFLDELFPMDVDNIVTDLTIENLEIGTW